MNDKIYPSMVIRSQSEAIGLLEKENEQLQNNWNELKGFVENDVKRWEREEQKWIEQGFMKFGGEANNKIIFKKVLSKMEEIESRKELRGRENE